MTPPQKRALMPRTDTGLGHCDRGCHISDVSAEAHCALFHKPFCGNVHLLAGCAGTSCHAAIRSWIPLSCFIQRGRVPDRAISKTGIEVRLVQFAAGL